MPSRMKYVRRARRYHRRANRASTIIARAYKRHRRKKTSIVPRASQFKMTSGSGLQNYITRQFNFVPRNQAWVAGNPNLQQPVKFKYNDFAFVDVFSLSQIQASISDLLQPYLDLYDSYKLLSVKMTLRPNYARSTMGDLQGGGAFVANSAAPAPFDSNMSNGITALSATGPDMALKYNFMGYNHFAVCCVDYDDQDINPLQFSLNHALNYQKNRILQIGQPTSITVIPKLTTVIQTADATGVTGIVANKQSKKKESWITTDNTAPCYMGLKWFFQGDAHNTAILTHHYNWTRIMTYKVAFKNLKI